MNILLLGSGGREHALAWKINQSNHCSRLWIAPGNAGTADCGENLAIAVDDFEAIATFCKNNDVQMVVVGPEIPLVMGIADYFEKDPALHKTAVIGPSASAARMEGSKEFAKEFLYRHKIPTAAYRAFDLSQLDAGLSYLDQHEMPVVLKADGLAAGKGVLICRERDEARREFRMMLEDGKFGEAGARVVVEAFLDGIELSVFVLSDGKNWVTLPTSKDYKRIGEKDSGLNTGGMGAVSPVPFADNDFMSKVRTQVIEPTMKGLRTDGILYRGFLYFGLIKVDGNPFVIEYNCRMGDPETQAVIPLIENDLVELFQAVADQSLDKIRITTKKGVAATIILASGGYPGTYQRGYKISGLDKTTDRQLVFHAGTTICDAGDIKTSGGRVLAVTSVAADLDAALDAAYSGVRAIQFDGVYYRKDIGFDIR